MAELRCWPRLHEQLNETKPGLREKITTLRIVTNYVEIHDAQIVIMDARGLAELFDVIMTEKFDRAMQDLERDTIKQS